MKISQNENIYTIIVDVKGSAEDIGSVIEHAKSGLEIFNSFDGFIAGATHLSEDKTQIVQYLQWRDQVSHEACMADERWNHMHSSRHFVQLMEAGVITVAVKAYNVVETRH